MLLQQGMKFNLSWASRFKNGTIIVETRYFQKFFQAKAFQFILMIHISQLSDSKCNSLKSKIGAVPVKSFCRYIDVYFRSYFGIDDDSPTYDLVTF